MARKRRRREQGSGWVFHVSRNDTYSIAWRKDGTRQYEHGFPDEDAARKRLAVVMGDIAADRAQPQSKATLTTLARKWLDARKDTHASVYDDRKRWELHLDPIVGRMKPSEVTPATVKDVIRRLRAKELSPGTCKLVVALLSSLFSDIVEDGHAQANPCKSLSKATRALLKSDHDPKNTPYLHEMADVVRVYQALKVKSPTVAVAYAIGAFAGLRTSEVRGLEWSHVDLDANTIHVQVQAGVDGPQPLKDSESRIVPIQPALAPVLAAWREFDGGEGLVCKPLRKGTRRFLDDHTMGAYLREVVEALGLKMECSCCKVPAAWYEYTRHTYACHMVMEGGSIEELSRSMGHSTIAITERHYVHLRPGFYTVTARNRLTVDLEAKPVHLASSLASKGVQAKPRKKAKAA